MANTTGVIYSVDTSSLMDWQARYYPTDVFAGLPTQVDGLGAAGRLFAVALVREEIHAVGTAGLVQWIDDRKDMIVPTGAVLAEAQAIQNQFTGLRDPKAEFEEADPYVIALAKVRDGIVVTQETPAAEKRNPKRTHFIPDVCRELGIPCISLLGLMRREGWRF
ncbi:MAG TPA: DUF4411 family protein [Polyangia bacterium]|nr:DUF4411 family protein [Polyangia bacterium]